jgi:hypothetical protein
LQELLKIQNNNLVWMQGLRPPHPPLFFYKFFLPFFYNFFCQKK